MRIRTTSADVVIVGAGVAGLAAALGVGNRRVHLICKGTFGSTGASPLAQGGLAAAIGADDSPQLHAADTLAVAGGTADPEAVSIVTGEAPLVVQRLLEWGAVLDRDGDDTLALCREAGHSRSRIVHARDATGAEIVRAASDTVRRAGNVLRFEHCTAIDLEIVRGRVAGLWTLDPDGGLTLHLAPAVVMASGGIGQLYARTTNPIEATADGLAMAARAGARLADLEMVQFHPTAIDAGEDPMPLVTEALRGAGAAIVDGHGRRFLLDVDARGELAPRDVVALAIYRHLQTGHRAWLDATGAVGPAFPTRFPTVFAACQRLGIDPRVSPIPVAPAAHYHMGGIAVDRRGRSSIEGLWACGESACTGLHGANRLASNSLLEGIVFGARVAADVARVRPSASAAPVVAPPIATVTERHVDVVTLVRKVMWDRCGLERDADGLRQAAATFEFAEQAVGRGQSVARNMVEVARLLVLAALARCESRGSHCRLDYPEADPAWARRHVVAPVGRQAVTSVAAGARR
jgi:L-aspartate oxidase